MNIGKPSKINSFGYVMSGMTLLLSEILAYRQRNSGLFGLRQKLNGERTAFELMYKA